MAPINRRSNAGFALAELMLAMLVAASLITGLTVWLTEQKEKRTAAEYASWMAQYINAVAGFMASQGATPPAPLVQNGTDWLKRNTCGGTFPPDAYFLSCNVPTDFNGVFDLPAPQVSFDWTTPTAPVADITFGPVQRDGDLAPKTAALLASEINARLEVDGYNHAGAFAIDPAIDPAVDPVGFQAELTAANLRGFVDTSIESTVFVRRDGNTIMTGPLINENDNWSLIGRDADGNENDAPQDPIASANLNDVFVRSAGDNGMWASETHELAEEAYRLAVRAPLFVTNIRSGDGVAKPDCPNPMIPKVYAEPAGFIGGPDLSDTRLVSGVRTRINDLGANWQIFMDILYEGQSSFQTVPSDEMGLIRVTVKCSPP